MIRNRSVIAVTVDLQGAEGIDYGITPITEPFPLRSQIGSQIITLNKGETCLMTGIEDLERQKFLTK